jgi:penicillin-binding protein 2
MIFTYDFTRTSFLEYYEIDEDASADEAFEALREYYSIDDSFSDEDAYYIIILRHAIREKGYLKYEPITLATDVSKKTAVLIQEQSMRFPNVSIEILPVRYYPQSNLASHVLGYLGKIASAREVEKYNAESGYQRSDLIGKIGIEGEYEDVLRGINGEKWIEVNAYGRFIKEIDDNIPDKRFTNIAPVAGKDIQLTIDMKLQEATKDYLVRTLEAISTGGVYESEYGDTTFKAGYDNASTGAVVVVDVRTGEVLSLVSYPDYDINLFSTGISQEDFLSLQPENKRNPLAPRPMYNIATLTAVQPGSTFKMITGFAGLQAGLDPNKRYTDAGYIQTLDGKTFGCWLWNKSRGTHGAVDLMTAIQVSCNYYFYDIANGFDYARNVSLPFEMNADKLIEAAKLFGLDEKSGVEIGERVAGVPDPEQKKKGLLRNLYNKLYAIGGNYFSAEIVADVVKFEEVVDGIIAIGNDNPTISRNGLISHLQEKAGIEDINIAANLADIVKYSYFNQMKWFEGDTFNLAIGQGGHAYTPVQMARYISAIANGGYLYDLTLIKSVDGEPAIREPFTAIDPDGYIAPLKEGMRKVAEPGGSAYSYFKTFPIKVGAKTGTAEKEGKLPPESEEGYLLEYLHVLAPSIDEETLELETARELRDRTDKIAYLYKVIAETEDENVKMDAQSELQGLTYSNYLNKGYAMRDALKALAGERLTDEMIDQYKDDYDNFTWFVSFAPYENPEIAVAVLIPQGGAGGNGASIVKDIYGLYFNVPSTKVQNQ